MESAILILLMKSAVRCRSVKITCLVSGDLNAGLGVDFNYFPLPGKVRTTVNRKKGTIDPGTE